MLKTNKRLTWVILTLAYSNIFAAPLSLRQVWLRLIKLDLDQGVLTKDLCQLIKRGLVRSYSGFYQLSTFNRNLSLEQRRRKRYALVKTRKISPVVDLAGKLPWVVGVGITGSVAVGNAKRNDDVDFLIVTRPHFLWLTRLIFTWMAYKKGKRRSFAKEEENSWCFNLWLTTDSLSLPKEKRSLYTAYDLLQVKWLVVKDRLALTFLRKNLWVEGFLPQYFRYCWFRYKESDVIKAKTSIWLWVLVPLNFLSYLAQRVYMQRHLTNEQVGYRFAFFHPRDTKGLIYKRLRRVLGEL